MTIKKNKIAEVLRYFLAPTDAESASGCDASFESDSDLDGSENGQVDDIIWTVYFITNLAFLKTRRYRHYLYAVSYTHLRAHETSLHLVCRLLLEKRSGSE